MSIPNGITLTIRDTGYSTQKVGNEIIREGEQKRVHFRTLKEIKAALQLQQLGKIRFVTKIPEEILLLLNLPQEQWPIEYPEPRFVVYRDEFSEYKKELGGMLEGASSGAAEKIEDVRRKITEDFLKIENGMYEFEMRVVRKTSELTGEVDVLKRQFSENSWAVAENVDGVRREMEGIKSGVATEMENIQRHVVDISGLKQEIETMKIETEKVNRDTLIVKEETNIVKEDTLEAKGDLEKIILETVAVKNQTSMVKEATEAAKENIENLQLVMLDDVDSIKGQLNESTRQVVTLSHGTFAVKSKVETLVDIEIEGHTVPPIVNSVLETNKKYVLADKKIRLVVDTQTVSGVAKFIPIASKKPKIIFWDTFEGKVSGSMAGSPHVSKHMVASVPTRLLSPSEFDTEVDYSKIMFIDGQLDTVTAKGVGAIAQRVFAFNLLESIEKDATRIPGATLAEKVTWLRTNIARISSDWHGYGSSVGGYKVNMSSRNVLTNTWSPWKATHQASKVTSLGFTLMEVYDYKPSNSIDANGIMYFLLSAEASDGKVDSVLYTDYINFEVEFSETADFTNSKIALYKVTDDEYTKILTEWNATEVARRFPKLDGPQHLQGIGIRTGGESPSHLYADVKLASIGTNRDSLYNKQGRWLIHRKVNTDNGVFSLLPTPQTVDVTEKVEGQLMLNGETQVIVDSGFKRTMIDGKSTWTKVAANGYTSGLGNVKLMYADNIHDSLRDAILTLQGNTAKLTLYEKAIMELYERVKALEV